MLLLIVDYVDNLGMNLRDYFELFFYNVSVGNLDTYLEVILFFIMS
jgi:hypothetical protein